MKRIDGPGHINHLFVNEDPATSRPPTLVTPKWLNQLQEEIVSLIEWAGIAPGDETTQLRQALLAKFAAAGSGLSLPQADARYLQLSQLGPLATDEELSAQIATHLASGDPHPQYVRADSFLTNLPIQGQGQGQINLPGGLILKFGLAALGDIPPASPGPGPGIGSYFIRFAQEFPSACSVPICGTPIDVSGGPIFVKAAVRIITKEYMLVQLEELKDELQNINLPWLAIGS